MFSPDAAVPVSVAARNPRRRQRTSSEDSVVLQHNPKRIRRSGLTQETFKPLEQSKLDGHIESVEEEPVVNGHANEPSSQRYGSADGASLAIRHRGGSRIDRERRWKRNDGSIELTRNENYVVTQLATTPDLLQDYHQSEKWRGEVSTQLGYALAITQTHAIVWRYVPAFQAADHLKPLHIKLPNPSSNPRHPLPVGNLVPTSSEPSLLLVSPTSGIITYWESLSGAASAEIGRQKQHFIQGSVPGLMSGETVTKVTEAEPRGFVVTLSTGRLAHLIVSDTQGKPSINVQFLRDNGAQSGGIFGSLKSVFSSAGWRRDIAAIRAGYSTQRGQRYMIATTTKAVFQIWDLNWNGSHTLIGDFDAKNDILKAIAEAAEVLDDHEEHQFEVLDAIILPKSSRSRDVAGAEQGRFFELMILTVIKGKESSRYALLGLTLTGGSVTVDVVHPITCYNSSLPAGCPHRPQLLVPESGSTAFVIFEKSLLLVSLEEIDGSPTSQLQKEAHALPDPFQDAIDFRRTKPYRVVGCASDPYDRENGQSSCLVMIFGFGLIRLSSLPLKEGQSIVDRATVTAKTKIEQAVFFGTLSQDLLDFSPRPEVHFSQEEIEAAALSVSHSIMSSTSMYIPTLGPSMDHLLQRRSTALAELNKYLRTYYEHELSRLTRWELLWAAEKMASAKAVWQRYNEAVCNQNKGSDGRNLLAEAIEAMSENRKRENRPENYETDGVRHWFINDIWRLENILPWAQNMVETIFQESVEDKTNIDQATQARFVSEANDIQLSALETAFRFREANVAAYGLENEIMRDGVLMRGYEGLPEIWTSTSNVMERVCALTDVSRELTKLNEEADGDEGEPASDLVFKLAADNPRQVQICCQTYIERFRWLKSRSDPESQAAGEKLMRTHFAIRRRHFTSLTEVGQPEMGIQLAEKYRDMQALVEIIDQELQAPENEDVVRAYKARIDSYFIKFGAAWANAYFTEHLNGGRAVQVLTENRTYKKHLTAFLRSHPTYAKVTWLNEILTEGSYIAAADSLEAAQEQETNLWSKRIGLSMGKLSLLAAQSKNQIKADMAATAKHRIDENVAVLAVQEKLYNHIKPTIRDALDADAETDLAMQRYGASSVKDRPILHDTLENCLRKLLAMETLTSDGLIDVLTLLGDEGIYPDNEGVIELRFLSALQILRLSSIGDKDPGHKELLEQFIWRRCMIQDNWEDINRTELKADTQVRVETGATSLFVTLKEGYRSDLFDRKPPPAPTSLTQAGTTIESLRISKHYSKMPESTLELLSQDLTAEAEQLEEYIEKGRLEEWWHGVIDAAKAAARAEADEEGEKNLQRRKAEQEFDRRLSKIDCEAFRKGGDEENIDEQGDVIMV